MLETSEVFVHFNSFLTRSWKINTVPYKTEKHDNDNEVEEEQPVVYKSTKN